MRGAATELQGVVAARGQPARRQAEGVHPVEPAAAPVLADERALLPAHPGDPGVAALDEVVDGLHHAGPAVHVDPGVPGGRLAPGPAERDERHAALGEPGGVRVAAVGVGDHEGVDGRGAEQLVVPVGGVVLGVGAEQQHVVARPPGCSPPASARTGPSGRWHCPPPRGRRAGRRGGRTGSAGCGRHGWVSSRASRSPPAPGPACPAGAARGCSARSRRSAGRRPPRRPRSRAWGRSRCARCGVTSTEPPTMQTNGSIKWSHA